MTIVDILFIAIIWAASISLIKYDVDYYVVEGEYTNKFTQTKWPGIYFAAFGMWISVLAVVLNHVPL